VWSDVTGQKEAGAKTCWHGSQSACSARRCYFLMNENETIARLLRPADRRATDDPFEKRNHRHHIITIEDEPSYPAAAW